MASNGRLVPWKCQPLPQKMLQTWYIMIGRVMVSIIRKERGLTQTKKQSTQWINKEGQIYRIFSYPKLSLIVISVQNKMFQDRITHKIFGTIILGETIHSNLLLELSFYRNTNIYL